MDQVTVEETQAGVMRRIAKSTEGPEGAKDEYYVDVGCYHFAEFTYAVTKTIPPTTTGFAPLPEQNLSIDTTTTITPTPPSPVAPITTSPDLESNQKSKSSSFFRHIFKRSSPTRYLSTDDITSRILGRSTTHDIGSPLTRTSSSSSAPPLQQKSPSESKSRSSINSAGSGGGRHTASQHRFTAPSLPTKSGRRMLNGRVYGSKHNANPFANVRDEPEFVEWGYGGMGSVNCSSDSKYSVLAKGAPALLSHSQAKIPGPRGGAVEPVERNDGVGVPSPDDEDDGSGMGWVKKRRLQRERERLAREKEAADTDSRRTSTDGSSAMGSTTTDLSTLATSSAPTTPPSTTDILPPPAQDYILEASTLHTPKSSLPRTAQAQPVRAVDEGGAPKEEDSDESEVEETEDHRKTSLGAGVEKISRHKEAVH
ncbi:hypothetical protein DFJ58DRAFT_842747 [Suillus subalutaceus]|uniref:uncharacterized protein n=1 Tax=Suillus subalutaceus TaxID=48586 RepID=UPI001B8860B3|nr:uncharacterized protein DFJ58DRAFT_842747 [Suillus subalutaceus]KAG1849170.1 hypothetical protein DFJ58DRAFT_842747 [Suillus subalutaceus]